MTLTYLDVVHGKVGPNAELKSDATATIIGNNGHDARRRLGFLRQVQRHLGRQNAVVVDVVLKRVDVGELGQVDRSYDRLAIDGRLAVIETLRRQPQLPVFRLNTPSCDVSTTVAYRQEE